MNDLIENADDADRQDPDKPDLSGARVIASANDLLHSSNGLEYAINGTVAALDLLAFAANPLKELVMAGVGFLIEHVDFLSEPLEWVAGDPAAINATKDTWQNIAQTMDQAGEDLKSELASLSEWEGPTATAYRSLLSDFGDAIKAGGTASEVMGYYMMVMGIWTAVTRGLLLELICDFVSRAIIYALSALASSWITLGGSFAAMVAGIVADAMSVFAKISQHISKLGQAMTQMSTRFSKLDELVGEIGRVLDRFGSMKKFDFNMNAIERTSDLHFDQLFKSIGDDAVPTPGSAGFRSGYQDQNAKTIYETMNDMWGSGNLPTPGLNNAHGWNSLGDILTGYPMTGFKSGLGGTDEAVQDGG